MIEQTDGWRKVVGFNNEPSNNSSARFSFGASDQLDSFHTYPTKKLAFSKNLGWAWNPDNCVSEIEEYIVFKFSNINQTFFWSFD
jgi:hypothetical protein